MSSCVRLTACISILFALGATMVAKSKTRPVEQTHFSAEEPKINRPIAIPEDVMAILGKQEVVEQELENRGLRPESLPNAWFSGSAVHLSRMNEPDLIVVANVPVSGANTTMFWLFRSTTNGHELILAAGAHDLIVKKKGRKGFRDIRTYSVIMMHATTLSYRFDGTKYTLFSTKRTPMTR